jgi:hypothetical protein
MATDNFISRPFRRPVLGELDVTSFTVGTSDTGTDFFSVRWQSDTGSGATGVIRDDLLKFLEDVEQFVLRGGKLQDGAGVPPTS